MPSIYGYLYKSLATRITENFVKQLVVRVELEANKYVKTVIYKTSFITVNLQFSFCKMEIFDSKIIPVITDLDPTPAIAQLELDSTNAFTTITTCIDVYSYCGDMKISANAIVVFTL